MEVDPRWLDDAKTLKIVRGQRGYVHDVTIVAKIVALFERIAELEALVKEYGEHQAFCSASEHPGVSCDCGLDAALGEVDGG